jgi:5-methylcytosine-specific restriction enzyme subunit McrC
MRNNRTIQVFEHQQLLVDNHSFQKQHWEALGWYNSAHNGDFFTLLPKGVRFNHYVGVIQIGNLTIEVLPKIGKVSENDNKSLWQKVLIDMLRECHWMQVYAHEKAALRFKPNSILEAYFEIFIHECEKLIRQGLVKKYRAVNSNSTTLKGKLLFARQVQLNSIHQERFYTGHHTFDRENIFNQILLKALNLVPDLSQSPYIKDKVSSLLLSFPELSDIVVSSSTFEKLVFDRKTTRYKEAIEIAAMLLLNYRPDIISGNNHILAILFDMNNLWEEYIFRQLSRYRPNNFLIRAQNSKSFWKLNGSTSIRKIRPDIVIHDQETGSSIILDTKWKIPDYNIPSDSDLKQMFVYNEYWSATQALLVYPNQSYTEDPVYFGGEFVKRKDITPNHNCGLLKVAVLDKSNTKLNNTIGQRINDFLNYKILNEVQYIR